MINQGDGKRSRAELPMLLLSSVLLMKIWPGGLGTSPSETGSVDLTMVGSKDVVLPTKTIPSPVCALSANEISAG